MRVLMVMPAVLGTDRPPVWAERQIDSITGIGLAVDTYVFSNRRSLYGLVEGGLALRRRAREFDADLVHIHFGAAQAVAGVLFSKKPVVISYCGSDLLGNFDERGRKTWSGWLSGMLSRLGAIGCRRAVAKSEELRQALWFSSLRRKCVVIPNGVDLETFRPMTQAAARSTLGWTHSDPVVLFMDRKGAWVKDPELAQAAYAEAKRKVGNLRLYVIENETPDRLPLLYNAADALLLTSRHEGSNNTIKEALACNLPIVATDCGDTIERLEKVHGCHICARDAEELGRKLSEVTTTRGRIEGRGHLQGLSSEAVAAKIKQVYEAALSYSPGRSPACNSGNPISPSR